MTVVLLSSDSLTTGREIAEGVAGRLGFRLVGRELLGAVAERFGIDGARLLRSLDDDPSLLGMTAGSRARRLASVQTVVVDELLADDVVCHGLAAHLYVAGVSHVLKVRVLADSAAMARELAQRRGVSVEKAERVRLRQIAGRRRWSLAAFGRDETDPSLYDLVIRLQQIEPERAVGMIADTAGERSFQAMTYSRARLQDVALEARARLALIERYPEARVQALHGRITVETTSVRREQQSVAASIEQLLSSLKGADGVEVNVLDDFIREAIDSFR